MLAINKKTSIKGFTLVEMMVVLVIFGILVIGIIGIFVSAVKTQKLIIIINQLIDQTSYAMEYMSRAARMAVEDSAPTCLSSVGNYEYSGGQFKFKGYSGECQTFYANSSTNQLFNINSILWGSPGLALTSSKLQLLPSKFFVNVSDGAGSQPKATIFMEIRPVNDPKPTIRIQTTVSQRNLNF